MVQQGNPPFLTQQGNQLFLTQGGSSPGMASNQSVILFIFLFNSALTQLTVVVHPRGATLVKISDESNKLRWDITNAISGDLVFRYKIVSIQKNSE